VWEYPIENNIDIMQYTWLKDSDWKEIYEWDLLTESKELDEYADEHTFYECVFNERLARFWFYNHFHKAFIINFNIERLKELKILWNIYENNNLLTND